MQIFITLCGFLVFTHEVIAKPRPFVSIRNYINKDSTHGKWDQECSSNSNIRETLSCRLYRENPTLATQIFDNTRILFDEDENQKEQSNPSFSSENKLLAKALCTSACETIFVQENSDVKVVAAFYDKHDNIAAEYDACLVTCRMAGPSYGVMLINEANKLMQNDLPDQSHSSTEKIALQRERRNIQVVSRRKVKPKVSNINSNRRLHGLRLSASSEEGRLLLLDFINAATPRNDNGTARRQQIKLAKLLTGAFGQNRTGKPSFVQATFIAPVFKKSSPNSTPPSTSEESDQSDESEADEESAFYEGSLERRKRELNLLEPNYVKPTCFIKKRPLNHPKVQSLDGEKAELFFFEGRYQNFQQRTCEIRHSPIEKILQTNRSSLCKQAFMTSYGLQIQLDQKGDFSFKNGERFSVEFRPFKLATHCRP